MKTKKHLLLLVVCTVFINGCRKQTEKEKEEETEKYLQIKTEVLELCAQHDAIIDWYKNLDLKGGNLYESLYTVQVQNVFLNQNKQPYLFFVVIDDIKKFNDKYILIVDQFYPYDYRQNLSIHLRLFCDRDTVDRIFKRRPSYVDRYALIASIKSIVKPDLVIEPDIEYDLLANQFDETHPDDIYDFLDLKISCENFNTFIATGKCEDLVFVGEDDWIDDPSSYERFLEVLDVNHPAREEETNN
ncbi:MAG TPA: hypothetical protein VMY06_00485 [Sedimentisphaerales bacterium]|nr:hypothetical protein [Sedimentisphaerales bacterium]